MVFGRHVLELWHCGTVFKVGQFFRMIGQVMFGLNKMRGGLVISIQAKYSMV